MVHPNVLRNVGYDADRYTGYAFGMGVERVAMVKYRINEPGACSSRMTCAFSGSSEVPYLPATTVNSSFVIHVHSSLRG